MGSKLIKEGNNVGEKRINFISGLGVYTGSISCRLRIGKTGFFYRSKARSAQGS